MTQISENSELSLFELAYLDRLAEKIDVGEDTKATSGPVSRDFCPDS